MSLHKCSVDRVVALATSPSASCCWFSCGRLLVAVAAVGGCNSGSASQIGTHEHVGMWTERDEDPVQSAGLEAAGARAPRDAAASSPSAVDAALVPLSIDFEPSDCPALELSIDVHAAAEYESARGVRIAVLQSPSYGRDNAGDPEAALPPIESWDRGEFPEGACVLRLRGVEAACYQNQESVALREIETDAGARKIAQASFHARRWAEETDLCDWPVPGCPFAEWDSFHGYWWYLTARAAETLLVVCAPSCSRFFADTTTLKLLPKARPGVCE